MYDLKKKVFDTQRIPECQQRLTYKGKILEDEKEFRMYDINDGSIINLEIRLINKTEISIETLTGKLLTLQVDSLDSIEKIKSKIKKKEGFLVAQQVLTFENKSLENDCKLSDYNIQSESKLQLELQSQEKVKIVEKDLFDPELDYDYTNVNDDGKIFKKGGEFYSRPCGWKSLAFKVKGIYENDDWLSCNNGDGEWPIAYHGTNLNRLEDLCLDEFDENKIRNLVDENGILVTPFIREASIFETLSQIGDKKILYVVQSRVNPASIIKRKDRKFWILASKDDLRPYAICYKSILEELNNQLFNLKDSLTRIDRSLLLGFC